MVVSDAARSNSSSDELPESTAALQQGFPLLSEVARPELYRTNAFRLLGLPVTATSLDIRRQLNKHQMMQDYGGGVPPARQPLPLMPSPEGEEVRKASHHLGDSQRRLLDELFWFWPLDRERGGKDPALEALARGDIATAYSEWTVQSGSGYEAGIAMHNRAVLQHALALDFESRLTWGDVPEDAYVNCAAVWHEAFRCWSDLLQREDFWSSLTDRVREFDDARLTTGSVRRIRDSLPSALLAINAQLAVEAAEYGSDKEVGRQLNIMRESGFSQEAVDGALRGAMEPISKRLKIMSAKAKEDAVKDRAKANEAARWLMEHSWPVLVVVDLIFGETNATREHLHDDIADNVLDCIVSFGKETKNWTEARDLICLLRPFAIGREICRRIEQNLEAVENNVGDSVCWFCGTNPGEEQHSFEFKMYGDVQRIPTHRGTRITWRHSTITVPRCAQCARKHRRAKVQLSRMNALLGLVAGVTVGAIWEPSAAGYAASVLGTWFGDAWASFSRVGFSDWIRAAMNGFPYSKVDLFLWFAMFGGGLGLAYGLSRGHFVAPAGIRPVSAKDDFPRIKELQKEAWKFGSEPPDE